MSIKKDLLKEIDKKAQKIRDKRVDAANNKTLEAAVYDFFKRIESSRALHNGERYDANLFKMASDSLKERIRGVDSGSKITVEWIQLPADQQITEAHTVRGVTIWWSKAYIEKNNVDQSYYIDLGQMLFL